MNRILVLLVFEGETKFFDHRVGQYLPGDSLNFGLGPVPVKTAFEGQFEVFALPNLLQTLIAHLLQSALDGFALRIENALLEGNVDVGLHGEAIILHRAACRRSGGTSPSAL